MIRMIHHMVLLSVERVICPTRGEAKRTVRENHRPSAGRVGPPVKTSGFRVRVGRVPKWTRAYIQVAFKKCSYMTHSYREAEAFTKSLRSGVTTRMEGGYTTKGPCATRGLLRGPLVLIRP
jgi:hypothetical protein